MKSIFLITLLLIPNLVFGQQDLAFEEESEPNHSSLYLGLILGSASTKEDFDHVFNSGGQEYQQESENFSFGIYAGFNFADVWALESSIVVTPGLDKRPSELPIDEVYLTTITLTPVLHMEVTEQIGLYVKAGLGFLIYVEDYKKHSVFNHKDGDYWAGVGLSVGLGLDFKVNKAIHLRLGFDYIAAEMDADEENHHINLDDIDEEYSLISMAMHYNF
ncbi:outer membrane beta-barrel protein [Thalassomonas sp. M1454]|uniref:outer membrane beta-barrel protein n=1 Tax=Thalassomonas sp. M1454 TaxID=2594477 RepID=UPI001180F5F7|nr:outer membrane beta-barrel protein [Thalassomonas sp. M1454]TRX56356.1 porin family protein [Thalassomonas sp. M1454]